jgi:hypothetical protein
MIPLQRKYKRIQLSLLLIGGTIDTYFLIIFSFEISNIKCKIELSLDLMQSFLTNVSRAKSKPLHKTL